MSFTRSLPRKALLSTWTVRLARKFALAYLETVADLYILMGNPHYAAQNLLIFQASGLDCVDTESIVKILLDLEAQQAI